MNLVDKIADKLVQMEKSKVVKKAQGKKAEPEVIRVDSLKELPKKGFVSIGNGFARSAKHFLWSIEKDGDTFLVKRSMDEEGNPICLQEETPPITASKKKATKITPDMEGTWFDSNRGIYMYKEAQELAVKLGWTGEPVLDIDADDYLETYEEAENYINTLVPEGFYFGNHPDLGDLGLWKIEDDSIEAKTSAYGDKRDYRKIDIYVDGAYKGSTNWAATLKEAKDKFIEKNPQFVDSKIQVEYSDNQNKTIAEKKTAIWKGRLQKQYEDFEEFEGYDRNYGLAERLGFDSAEEAWEANPMIQGGVNPEDYKVVTATKKIAADYPFLDKIADADKLKNDNSSDLVNLQEGYTGDIYLTETENHVEPEIIINVDSKTTIENFLDTDASMTEEIQTAFENYDGGSWSEWIENWLKDKGYTVGFSGNTYNEDNFYFWGNVFEYVSFTGDKTGAVIMWHGGGDTRVNYDFPVVYLGDFDEFFLSQSISDPKEEIAHMLGYNGDYANLVSDINKWYFGEEYKEPEVTQKELEDLGQQKLPLGASKKALSKKIAALPEVIKNQLSDFLRDEVEGVEDYGEFLNTISNLYEEGAITEEEYLKFDEIVGKLIDEESNHIEELESFKNASKIGKKQAGGGAGISFENFELGDGILLEVDINTGEQKIVENGTIAKFDALGYDDGMTNVKGDLLTIVSAFVDFDVLKEYDLTPELMAEYPETPYTLIVDYINDVKGMIFSGWVRGQMKAGDTINVKGSADVGVFDGAGNLLVDARSVPFEMTVALTEEGSYFYQDVFTHYDLSDEEIAEWIALNSDTDNPIDEEEARTILTEQHDEDAATNYKVASKKTAVEESEDTPVSIKIVKIDETEYWNKSIIDKTGKIWTYYIYNENEVTNLAEITGSYYLIPIDFETENQLDDEVYEEVQNNWQVGTDPMYIHTRQVENMNPKEGSTFDSMEEAEEYYRGNPPYFTANKRKIKTKEAKMEKKSSVEWEKEAVATELYNHFNKDIDEDDTEALEALLDEINESLDLDKGRYDSLGNAGSVTVDGTEYNIIEDEDEAERIATELVKNDLETEPSMFNQDWLQSFITISNTDKRIMISEEEDTIRTDIEYDADKMDETDDELNIDTIDLHTQAENVAEEKEFDSEEEKEEWIEEHYEEFLEKAVEDARKEYVEKEVSDRLSDFEQGLEDPVDYFVNQQGIYSVEDLMKANFIMIDIDAAAEDAISTDGWAHFLSHNTGNYDTTANGLVFFEE